MPPSTTKHQDLAEELLAISSPEERLEWLMERSPIIATIPTTDRNTASKIEGCLSGLWLKATLTAELLTFSCASDSHLVQGIVSFVCDIYSTRSPSEVLQLGDKPIVELKLDGLLSTTRKRALWSSYEFITSTARRIRDNTAQPA